MKNLKYGLLCFIPTIILLLFWNFLPDKIATHINIYGNADSLSSKWYLTLFVPILGFLGHAIYMIILDKKPEWIGRKGFRKYSFLFVPVLTTFAIGFMLWSS